MKQMELELKKQQGELEAKVQERTKQLESAMEVKARFLATMSHGKVSSYVE